MTEAIDLALLKGTPVEREATSAALLKTLKTRGVAKLKNHGLPDHLVEEMFDYVSIFALIQTFEATIRR